MCQRKRATQAVAARTDVTVAAIAVFSADFLSRVENMFSTVAAAEAPVSSAASAPRDSLRGRTTRALNTFFPFKELSAFWHDSWVFYYFNDLKTS